MNGPAISLLANLRRLGVRLRADGDRLAADAPAGVLSDEMKARIKRYKVELLTALALSDPAADETKAAECPLLDDRHDDRVRTYRRLAQSKTPTDATASDGVRDDSGSCKGESQADRMWARFWRVAIPRADGWTTPGAPDWTAMVMNPDWHGEPYDPMAQHLPGRPGWTRRAWGYRLRQLAGLCEELRPDLAMEYRREADDIGRESANGS